MTNYPLMTSVETHHIANGVLLTINLRPDEWMQTNTVIGPLHYHCEADALDAAPRLVREGREAMAQRELEKRRLAAERERAEREPS